MNNALKDKMYNYEVAPPPGTWDGIAASLDSADLDARYPQTLRELSVTPPASAWNKIAETLTPGNIPAAAPVRSISPWIKYAAAAAILAFLAWGGFTLFNNNNRSAGLASEESREQPSVPGKSNSTEPVSIPSTSAPITEIADAQRDEAALEASKKTYARLNTPAKSKLRNAADFYFSAPEDAYYGDVQTRGLDFSEPQEVSSFDNSNRYIMLMTPDGHIIRISKKLSGLVCCVAGEEDTEGCTDQLNELRQKFANPSATQSPADFMDILSLIRSL